MLCCFVLFLQKTHVVVYIHLFGQECVKWLPLGKKEAKKFGVLTGNIENLNKN